MGSAVLFVDFNAQKTKKVILGHNIPSFILFLSPFFGKRAHISSDWQWPASPDAHQKVGTGEQHVKAVAIFCQPLIHRSTIPEEALDDQKWMLDLGAYR